MELFEPILEEGKDLLHLTLSSGISGSINLQYGENSVGRKISGEKNFYCGLSGSIIRIWNVGGCCSGKSGKGIFYRRKCKWLEENRNRLHHWFFSTDLTSFIRGGRISKVSGFVGQALNICPLMNVNTEGKLIPRNKYRGKKQVIREMVKRMEEHAQNQTQYSGKCMMSCSACEEDARKVADLVEEKFPNLNGKVQINSIGTVIGSHTGPGTVALFSGEMRELSKIYVKFF